ncbi:MAG TPA: asparagine synthase (glutamine-hydrolyzing) [Terriglobales bacterium]|nr:asparagine synthase (glutamine-hydrolyzing) [Terriglobales bacterium]
MCGISGFLAYRTGEPASDEVLARMLWSIRHRGPDDEGLYLDGELGLGVRRLSIIDPAGGRQPIGNEEGSVILVFNGEIYNYLELRDRLLARGHKFASASDTEVIVHLYEAHGDDCIEHLRGMFAFALWDRRRKRLLLARDRLGIKPLYYSDRNGLLVFGSEIKALLQHPDIGTELDLRALGNFLSLKYVPAPDTMFAGICALPPGHLLTCDAQGIRVRRYWDIAFTPFKEPYPEQEYGERLEALLRESVKLHLVSDVPFGAFLSGGLDSSTVVALMSESLNVAVKTFSVGYTGPGDAFSELPYARMVAQRYETDHHEVFVGAGDFVNLAEKVVWHLDQPIADPAALPNYMVAELASREVKMVLTGEGGDELFAGYARYAGERLSPLFRALPRPAGKLMITAAERFPRLRRWRLALGALTQADEISRLINWFPLFNPEAKSALLSEQVKQNLNGGGPQEVFAEQLSRAGTSDHLNRMLYVDTKLWLPDDLLARGDKTSMAASVEARVPLLDYKLVEFAASLPTHLKVNGLARKYLLKKVAARWLPAAVVHRKKQGFPVPMAVWFRGEARSFVRDLQSAETVRRRGLFDCRYVQRLLDDHDLGTRDNAALIWALVSVELWHRLFLDSRAAIPALEGSGETTAPTQPLLRYA